MFWFRKKRIWNQYGMFIPFMSNEPLRKEILDKMEKEERHLSASEVDKKSLKHLESCSIFITTPFFILWLIVFMPLVVILWIITNFKRELETL